MNIIMTGATGFVGSHLLRLLASRHHVYCLARDTSRVPTVAGAAPIGVNLEDPNFTRALPARADAVVHLAQGVGSFPNDADHIYTINLASTQKLASYSRRAGVSRFVFTSSGSVYRKTKGALYESSPTDPSDWYSFTKIASENLLACYQTLFEVAILRLFAPYGEGQHSRLIPSIIDRVRQDRPVTVNGQGHPIINPIHIDDLSTILVQALEGTGTYTVNVAGPETVSIPDIARIAGDAVGRTPMFEAGSSDPANYFNLIGDTQQMMQHFDVGDMIPPRRGIRSMIASSG